MTRKHFKLIAEILRNARPTGHVDQWELAQQQTIDRLTEEFADALKQTNPYFKKDTFMRAAGFSQG
jgi:hypothetical protein